MARAPLVRSNDLPSRGTLNTGCWVLFASTDILQTGIHQRRWWHSEGRPASIWWRVRRHGRPDPATSAQDKGLGYVLAEFWRSGSGRADERAACALRSVCLGRSRQVLDRSQPGDGVENGSPQSTGDRDLGQLEGERSRMPNHFRADLDQLLAQHGERPRGSSRRSTHVRDWLQPDICLWRGRAKAKSGCGGRERGGVDSVSWYGA